MNRGNYRECRCAVCGGKISEGDALTGGGFGETCSEECHKVYYSNPDEEKDD